MGQIQKASRKQGKFSIGGFFGKHFKILMAVVFVFLYVSFTINQPRTKLKQLKSSEKCEYGFVYVYELPSMFNVNILRNCHELNPWHSRCNAVCNGGFGPRAAGISKLVGNLSEAWYWTDMHSLEVIYHERMLADACRTTRPESATAFFIPFYAGFAVEKYLFMNSTTRERDRLFEELLNWVQVQPPWKRSNGSDHFIALGRTKWDFLRSGEQGWGSSFLNMPPAKRITKITREHDPWDSLDISVPYPTGFHPKSRSEIDEWMKFAATRNRPNLLAFVGARRKLKNDFRTILQNHCASEAEFCKLVNCRVATCIDGTTEILSAFLSSNFCLQPRGDSWTRRSFFDCILGGSIPVIFWERSIRHQYELFLGNKPESFSVFIDQALVRNGTSVREVLQSYSRDEVGRLRENVISLIPKIVYNHNEGGHRDAFDVALEEVLRRFKQPQITGS